ncbi:MAG: endolytic transglycosylase MltG [Butyrivibrio sp.]|nr:endolytic transglycosylase MltG [Butyrivibrio sp.]
MNLAKKLGIGMIDTIVRLVFVVIVVLLIIKLSKTAYYYGYNIFNQTPVATGEEGRTVSVTIEEGDTVEEIGEKLDAAGLIVDKKLFKWQEKTSEYSGQEKPGTYSLSTTMTPDDMIRTMAGYDEKGNPIEEVSDEEVEDIISNIEDGEGGDEDAGNDEVEDEDAGRETEGESGE